MCVPKGQMRLYSGMLGSFGRWLFFVIVLNGSTTDVFAFKLVSVIAIDIDIAIAIAITITITITINIITIGIQL